MRDLISPKNPAKTNFSTYSQYQTLVNSHHELPQKKNPSQPDETPEPPKNDGMPILDILNDTPNQHYHNRDVAHAAAVKYENNRYITLVNVEFGSNESDSIVNIASTHRKLFAAIKLLDPSAKIITDDDTVIYHPKEFPMGPDYKTNSPLSTIAKPDFHVFRPPRHRFHQDRIVYEIW